jgi:predicted GH43/DUF377 family glycosyl hydrolase
MKTINVKRTNISLQPDRTRVLARPFRLMSDNRSVKICARVMALPESEVHELLEQVMEEFGDRHPNVRGFLQRQYEHIRPYLLNGQVASEERMLLLGGYFTHEFSLEAAALFNPSIVPHPDQSGLPLGSLRFVMSLRATAEGHISSITFRTGLVDAENNITVDTPKRFSLEPKQVSNAIYEKALFARKLKELKLDGSFNEQVLKCLGDTFTMNDLRTCVSLEIQRLHVPDKEITTVARETLMLAQSNYEVQFEPDSRLSERVLFPATPSQSNGIEDARFVLFHDDDGTPTYYATYTAYDGRMILPQFLETSDFLYFKFFTLNGPAVENKGMALFPRKIKGRYAMLGRQDAENIYVMFSDHLHFWHTMQLVLEPSFPWEFIQLGNCGSPIETEKGWLVISHGVGPMRKYCIGAFLLDLEDPTKVIGRLREPLIKPNKEEREGYVPNVVYSCGSLLHGRQLIIPYGMSDYATTFATVPVDEVLAAME